MKFKQFISASEKVKTELKAVSDSGLYQNHSHITLFVDGKDLGYFHIGVQKSNKRVFIFNFNPSEEGLEYTIYSDGKTYYPEQIFPPFKNGVE